MDNMTIKDLYEWAKARGIENNLLVVSYACCDDWYSFDNYEIKEQFLIVNKDMVNISIM